MPLNTIVTDFVESHGYSLSSNGYYKLPSGLIIQWGSASPSSSSFAVTFPIVFPNTCFHAGAGNANSIAGGVEYVQILTSTISVTGFTSVSYTDAAVGTAGAVSYTWLAIGY